jgi:hypothetical protein
MNLGAKIPTAWDELLRLLNTTPATACCAAVRVPPAVTEEDKSEKNN